MSYNIKLFGIGAKTGVLGGLYCGLLSAIILSINNPLFVDNLFVGVLFFLIVSTLLGSSSGGLAAIPILFLSVRKDYDLIKNRIIFASLIFPVLLFCVFLVTSCFILVKNKFLEVPDIFFLTLFLLITVLLPVWGLLILRSPKRGIKRFVAPSNQILLFIMIVIGISGIVYVPQRNVYSTAIHKDKKKIIVIAIGGATWKVINPLLKENELPNIAQIMRDGSYGSLESLDNMASAVTWASGATGGLPENHGISSFEHSSKSYRIKTFWEVAEEYGMSVGVFGYLNTWPPKMNNGYIIPGWDSLNDETIPKKLGFVKRLEKMEKQGNRREMWDYFQFFILAVKNGLRLETIINSAVYISQEKISNLKYLDRNYKSHLLKLALTSDIFTYLYKKYNHDVSVYYNGAADGVAHFYWRFFDPEKFNNVKENELRKYGHVLKLIYKKIDEAIGKILREVDESTTVVVFSNHGGKASPNNPRDRTYYLLNTQNLLKGLGLLEEVSATQISRIDNFLINSGKKEDLKRVADLLRELEVEESHQKLINVTYIDEDLKVITVAVNHKAVVDEKASVEFPNSRVEIKDLVERAEIPYSAVHDSDGVIFIKGPNINNGYEIKDATLLDVAPTILAILGLPTDTAVDGKVLTKVFEQPPY